MNVRYRRGIPLIHAVGDAAVANVFAWTICGYFLWTSVKSEDVDIDDVADSVNEPVTCLVCLGEKRDQP